MWSSRSVEPTGDLHPRWAFVGLLDPSLDGTEPNTAERSPTPKRRNPARERDFDEAAEGIRTLDLLHGKRLRWAPNTSPFRITEPFVNLIGLQTAEVNCTRLATIQSLSGAGSISVPDAWRRGMHRVPGA